jgi:hypothetical protein
MLSSQWFTLEQANPKILQTGCKADSDSQCVVCLTERANLVWMPCGHLTMCDACGQYMLDNNKLDCVMCKASPNEIYHLAHQAAGKGYPSDYHYQIRII